MLYINIPNKTKRYLSGYTSPVLTVPAMCASFTKRIQDEWFVRAFYEYKYCKERNGVVFYPTLTYNCEHHHYK